MSTVKETGPTRPAGSGAPREAFLARVRSLVGTPARPPWKSPDPVNASMIRHWCEVMGDRNPVHTDEAFAAGSVHGGIVAPPTMLDAWVMRGFIPSADPSEPDQGQAALLEAMAEEGFTAIIATNCDQQYHRYLRPGDVITAVRTIDSISEEKQTALGAGHFFTVKTSYADQRGEEVGVQSFRMLVYRPANGAQGPAAPATPKPPEARRPRPAMSRDTAFFWEGAGRRELLIQRCAECRTLRHPPGPMCPRCNSTQWDVVPSSGRGEVYTYVVYHRPAIPPFTPPYVVALIALEEGVRVVANLIEVPPSEVRIGMPVEVHFVDVDGELTLPMFVPRS